MKMSSSSIFLKLRRYNKKNYKQLLFCTFFFDFSCDILCLCTVQPGGAGRISRGRRFAEDDHDDFRTGSSWVPNL